MAQIKDLTNNEYKCNRLDINDKYYLFIEELEPIDNEEDILIELFDSKENDMICNCLDYKNHLFTSETKIEDVKSYALEVINLYEHDN